VIKETLVLAALAISSPAVLDGDTVRIAGVEDLPNRNVSRKSVTPSRTPRVELELSNALTRIDCYGQ
jgi:hypothetical protein